MFGLLSRKVSFYNLLHIVHLNAFFQVLRRLTAVASLNETWAIPAADAVGRFKKGSALAEKAEKVFLAHMVIMATA